MSTLPYTKEKKIMENNPWIEKLNALKNGEIAELYVPYADFMEFRKGWLTFENKMHFKGIASIGGNVTYVYDPESDPGKKSDSEE